MLARMTPRTSNIYLALLFASGLVNAQAVVPTRPSSESRAHGSLKTARVGASAEVSSDDDTDCPADVPQSELVQCMAAESTALEARIDRYVRTGLDAIDHNDEVTQSEKANERREFIAAQASWAEFRNHLCNAWYWMTDGTGATLDSVACREKTDRRRIRELLEFPGTQ